jgi:hypothetical protein
MVPRFVLNTVVLAASVSAALGQNTPSSPVPMVSLRLPSGVASESVGIRYFMVGSFGGYGGFVKAEKGLSSHAFDAASDGKPATNVKVIAYLPGCEIVKLDIPIEDTQVERQLECKPLGSIRLRGQISPLTIFHGPAVRVYVNYLATWDHEFFGIMDGPVTSIALGNVAADDEGRFEVEVPDYFNQQDAATGAFEFVLREPASENIRAFLKAENGNESGWLKVRELNGEVQLIAGQDQSQPPR